MERSHIWPSAGARHAPHEWNEKVFDRVWEIRYEHGEAKFENLPQHALPADSD